MGTRRTVKTRCRSYFRIRSGRLRPATCRTGFWRIVGQRKLPSDEFYETNMKGWGPELVKRRPDITMEKVDKFLTKMYRTSPDFVFTVTRDFVRNCQTPVLILPDDIPAHPYAVAMEAAMLAPKAEVSIFPWKEPKERIPLAVRQIRSFLRANRPASG
jgi:hypothetical protein